MALFFLLACQPGSALDVEAGWGVRADIFQGTIGSSLYIDAQYGRLATGLTIYRDNVSFASWWSASAVAKLPFTLGPVTIFPEIGADYELLLTNTDLAGTSIAATQTNQLWLLAGAGVGIVIHQDQRTGTPWRVSIHVLGGWNPFALPEDALTLKVDILYGFVIPHKQPAGAAG